MLPFVLAVRRFAVHRCGCSDASVSLQERRCACRSRGRVIAIACQAYLLLSLGRRAPRSLNSLERRGVARGVASENRPGPLRAQRHRALRAIAAARGGLRSARAVIRCLVSTYVSVNTVKRGRGSQKRQKCQPRAARATRATRRPSRPRRRCLCRPNLTMGACGARKSRTATCYLL